MGTRTWTVEQEKLVLDRLQTGATYAEVAAELGGQFTRNAVIGKATRLGVSGQRRVRREAGKTTVTRRTGKPTPAATPFIDSGFARPPVVKSPKLVEITPEVAPVDARPVGYIERRRGQCAVIINDRTDERAVCCGAKVVHSNFEFCATHVARCLQATRPVGGNRYDMSVVRTPYVEAQPQELA